LKEKGGDTGFFTPMKERRKGVPTRDPFTWLKDCFEVNKKRGRSTGIQAHEKKEHCFGEGQHGEKSQPEGWLFERFFREGADEKELEYELTISLKKGLQEARKKDVTSAGEQICGGKNGREEGGGLSTGWGSRLRYWKNGANCTRGRDCEKKGKALGPKKRGRK